MRNLDLCFTLSLAACGASTSPPTLPNADGVHFVGAVDHPYFPLPVGATWHYENADENIDVTVKPAPEIVNGVSAVAVHDHASDKSGGLVEDTTDWFAQDDAGNVWYLGEATCTPDSTGACTVTEGSWAWGTDGALPGIIMPAQPTVDHQPYRQEYYPGNAEDVGEVVALGQSVDVPAGSFSDCIETHDTSTLETSADEHKFYCRGVGLVKTLEPDVVETLISKTGL